MVYLVACRPSPIHGCSAESSSLPLEAPGNDGWAGVDGVSTMSGAEEEPFGGADACVVVAVQGWSGVRVGLVPANAGSIGRPVPSAPLSPVPSPPIGGEADKSGMRGALAASSAAAVHWGGEAESSGDRASDVSEPDRLPTTGAALPLAEEKEFPRDRERDVRRSCSRNTRWTSARHWTRPGSSQSTSISSICVDDGACAWRVLTR